MIPLSEINALYKALPKASISTPKEGYSWILDAQGEKIGAIHWSGTIEIYDDYPHSDKVVERIGADRFDVDYGDKLYGAEKS